MQVVAKAVLPPSVCFICEQGWNQTGDPTRFVDTKFVFEPGGYTRVNGTKYLCEHCIREAARELGIEDEMVPAHEVQALKAVAAEARYITEQVGADLQAMKLAVTGVARGLKKYV